MAELFPTGAAVELQVQCPTTNAQLAAAVAAFIVAEEKMWASRSREDNYIPLAKFGAREAAYHRLKTIFETEFPL